jgi:predicted helicase
MYTGEFIKLINNFTTFQKFCESVGQLKTTKEKGDVFEQFTKLFFLSDNRWRNLIKSVWLLSEVPVSTKKVLKIPDNNIGIDLVLKTYDDKYFAVQSKFRTNIDTIVPWKELATFFGQTFGLTDKFEHCILFTNTTTLSRHIKPKTNFTPIMYHSIKNLTSNTIANMKAIVRSQPVPVQITKVPRDYQTHIANKGVEFFKTHIRGRLYMPCGTGKTFTCQMMSSKIVTDGITCVVVPSLYLLTQMYENWCNEIGCPYLLIGSDGEVDACDDMGIMLTTNVNEITQFIKSTKTPRT